MMYISVGYACHYESNIVDSYDFSLLFFEVVEMPSISKLIELFKEQYEYAGFYTSIKVISVNQHDFNSWNNLRK